MRAVEEMRKLFREQEVVLSQKIQVSCGWPAVGGRGGKRIGECWHHTASADGHFEIFVSPILESATRVLDVLLHELCHVSIAETHGENVGHRSPFARLCNRMGLVQPWTATKAGPELQARLEILVQKLGKYPHGGISPVMKKKKQTTRMLKAQCGVCGYTVRLTQKWIDEVGAPICPAHADLSMDVEGQEKDKDEEGNESGRNAA